MKYWIGFVRELDPNRGKEAGAPHWENLGEVTAAGGRLRRLKIETNGTMMEEINGGLVERCNFWKGLAGRMEQ